MLEYKLNYVFEYVLKVRKLMQQIVGVTELQRKFRRFFDDVVNKRSSIVLTRGSRPEAVLLPYDEYLRLQELQEREVLARFDLVRTRLSQLNAGISEAELDADIDAARSGA